MSFDHSYPADQAWTIQKWLFAELSACPVLVPASQTCSCIHRFSFANIAIYSTSSLNFNHHLLRDSQVRKLSPSSATSIHNQCNVKSLQIGPLHIVTYWQVLVPLRYSIETRILQIISQVEMHWSVNFWSSHTSRMLALCDNISHYPMHLESILHLPLHIATSCQILIYEDAGNYWVEVKLMASLPGGASIVRANTCTGSVCAWGQTLLSVGPSSQWHHPVLRSADSPSSSGPPLHLQHPMVLQGEW